MNDPMNGRYPRWQPVQQLGAGAYGQVWLYNYFDPEHPHLPACPYALKFVSRADHDTPFLLREMLNQCRLRDHDHIIQLYQVFLLDQTYVVLVLEYAPGGTLLSHIERHVRTIGTGLNEVPARWYFQQILSGLHFCHIKGVCVRDIKLENTLLTGPDENIVKLADFGLSKDGNFQSMADTLAGSPGYIAPEVLRSGNQAAYDGCQADVWSLGVLLYTMVYGCMPFYYPPYTAGSATRENVELVTARIQTAQYTFPEHRQVSAEFKDLVKRIFVPDPAQRITLPQIIHHPWCASATDIIANNEEMLQRQVETGVHEETIRYRQQLVALLRNENLLVEQPMHDQQEV